MDKIYTFILSFFLFLLITSLKAEVINKIEINGNKRISDETVKVYGSISLGKDLTKSDVDKILQNLYSTEFFKSVSVELDKNVLKVNLKEYPIINELVILGESKSQFRNEIKKLINLKKNGSYIDTKLSQDIEIIKKLYSSIGYNFSTVETKIKKIDDYNLDLVFDIKKGNLTSVSKIFFTGDKKIKDKRLRDIIVSEEDKFWKIITKNTRFSLNLVNLDKRLLENYYKSIGYYDVQVSSSSAEILDTGKVNITYSIDSGKRYIIDKIKTDLDPVFDNNIFFPLNEVYRKYIGDYYSPFKIKKILDEIDIIIEKNNLQFVEHRVKETIQGDTINLSFIISEGEKILVERINIKGNNITNESVIRSELILDEGDPFTKLGLDKSVANIKSRNIFKSVKANITDGSSSDQKIIDIEVEEKPTGEISAGAGVGTDGGTFAIKVKENNWLGEGKKVSFDVELSEESLKGEVSYENPNYNLLGNSLKYSLTNVTNDKPDQGYENTLVSAGVGTSFEQFKDTFTSIGISASYDDLKTLSNASSSLKKQSGQFSEIAAEYGIAYDQRDRTFMPTAGTITKFVQTLPIYADKPFIGNTFMSSSYKSFGENVVGAGKILLTSVNGLNDEDVRISKRKSLSSSRIRGFERGKIGPVDGTDHIGGNYAAAVNFEANLPNFFPESSNTDFGIFLDFANVWGVDYDDSIDDSNEIRSSSGITLSWNSPLGPMTFVFAQPITHKSSDKTQSFNFNIGTSF